MTTEADQDEAPRLLLKGLEEEVYTGTVDADVLPLSHRIAADLRGFVTEPDSRNVEYTTQPYRSYQTLLDRGQGSYRRVCVQQRRPALGAFKAELTRGVALVRDVLFCCQGIDGTYVRFSAQADGYAPPPPWNHNLSADNLSPHKKRTTTTRNSPT